MDDFKQLEFGIFSHFLINSDFCKVKYDYIFLNEIQPWFIFRCDELHNLNFRQIISYTLSNQG